MSDNSQGWVTASPRPESSLFHLEFNTYIQNHLESIAESSRMTNDAVMQQFQILEDNFNDVLVANNPGSIATQLSDDWVLVEPQFGIITKQQFLNAIETGVLSHSSMKKEILRVQFADNIAISTSRGKNVGVYNNKPFDSEHWVTNIYKNVNGNWVCVMTQEAPVSCK